VAAIDGIGFGPDLQRHLAAISGDIGLFDVLQLAGHQCKQIARLGMRIDKPRPVFAVHRVARAIRIAAGQQHRKARAIGPQRHRVARLHVRPIRKKRDVPEALGFALGQQETRLARAREIQTLQRRVRRWSQAHARLQHAAVARAIDFQLGVGMSVGAGRQGFAVQRDGQQFQLFALQTQRKILRRVASQQQSTGELGVVDAEFEIHLDRFHPPCRRPVVGEPDHGDCLLLIVVHADHGASKAVRLT
jgi:hypothetical protein